MILMDKIYQEFINCSGLKDSVHKTIFVKIQNLLNDLQSIKFKSLIYNSSEDVSSQLAIDFSESEEIPVYITDFIINCFENVYSIPEPIEGIFLIEYKEDTFEIKISKGRIIVPTQLQFMVNTGLIYLFVQNTKIKSVSKILIDFLCRTNTEIPEPLLKVFHGTAVSIKDTSPVNSIKLMKEELELKKEALLEEYEKVLSERKKFQEDLRLASFYKQNYSIHKQEYDSLKLDTFTLKENCEQMYENLEKCEKTLIEITDNLQNLPEDESLDRDFLISKKVNLTDKKVALTTSIGQTEQLIKSNKIRLEEFEANFKKLATAGNLDSNQLESTLDIWNAKAGKLYSDLETLDTNIRHLSEQEVDSSIQDVQESYADIVLKQPLDSDIVKCLQKPVYTSSVQAIFNYLEYLELFNYKVQKLTSLEYLINILGCSLNQVFLFERKPTITVNTILIDGDYK